MNSNFSKIIILPNTKNKSENLAYKCLISNFGIILWENNKLWELLMNKGLQT